MLDTLRGELPSGGGYRASNECEPRNERCKWNDEGVPTRGPRRRGPHPS